MSQVTEKSARAMESRPGAGAVPLGAHSARGLVYLFASTSAAKVVGFATQLALLYLLGKNDFGVVSLAYTITIFVQVIEQGGVGDVLVSRRAFRRWAIPGFWLAMGLGVVSTCLILLSAPIAAAVYGKDAMDRQQLFWVLVILAPSSLANGWSVVPRAQLSRDLRFRALAGINFFNIVSQRLMTVALAAAGFGPYSFVIPTPVVGFLTAAFLWWWVRPPWAIRLKLRRWRYLIGDSTRLFVAEFGRALLDQSDYMLLGIFRTLAEVGVYTVGFIFSIQTLQLLTANMSSILFPAFTKLNDQPEKQVQAFLKAQRILAMLGVSGCLLQTAVAQPFAQIAFPAKWYPSIAVIQILSLGMATRMIGGASFALLKSQGRFQTILIYRWAFVIVQVVALVIALAMGGGVQAVAIVVSAVASLIGPLTFHSAVRPYGVGWSEVVAVLLRPIVCAGLSVGLAWWIAQGMAARGYGPILQLVETVAVAAILNLLLARLWMRPVWDDFWVRLRNLIPRRSATSA
jgi:O-antigen/teichoic acid export membrane protein